MQPGDGWAPGSSELSGVVTKAAPPETVEAAVTRDVQDLGVLPVGSAAIVATALALARELDTENSATSKSMCARALVEAMERLRELAPPAEKADKLDELKQRREKRKSKAS